MKPHAGSAGMGFVLFGRGRVGLDQHGALVEGFDQLVRRGVDGFFKSGLPLTMIEAGTGRTTGMV